MQTDLCGAFYLKVELKEVNRFEGRKFSTRKINIRESRAELTLTVRADKLKS